MALTVETILNVRKRCFPNLRGRHIAEQLKALFDHLNHAGNPDLQFVEISALQTADKVVADVACKLYAVYIKKPAASTTDAWFKGSDHAAAAAANGDVVAKLLGTGGGGKEYMLVFPTGLLLGTGLTVGSHTAVGGAVKSAAADAPVGFAIVGAS